MGKLTKGEVYNKSETDEKLFSFIAQFPLIYSIPLIIFSYCSHLSRIVTRFSSSKSFLMYLSLGARI